MAEKESLLNYLKESLMILNDGFTFTWLRLSKYKSVIDNELGSGNYLALLGAFCTLNLASKIHYLINNDLKLEEKSKLNSKVNEKLEKLTKKERNRLEVKSIWKINEETAFINMISWYNKKNPENKLGLSSENACKTVWKKVRNAIAHTGSPANYFQVAVLHGNRDEDNAMTRKEVELALQALNSKAFFISPGPAVEFNLGEVDFVIKEVQILLAILCEEVSNMDTNSIFIKQALGWTQNNIH
jgi:hypothetical protein